MRGARESAKLCGAKHGFGQTKVAVTHREWKRA